MLIASCKIYDYGGGRNYTRVLLFLQINTRIGMTSFLYSTFRSIAHTISNFGKKKITAVSSRTRLPQLGGGSPKWAFLKKGLNGGTTITDRFRLEDHYGTGEDNVGHF